MIQHSNSANPPSYPQSFVDESMVKESLKIDVKRALNELKDRERDVLEEYYGFNGKPKTLSEIANKYGLSRERIRQIHVKAIRILRVKSTYARSPIRHLQYYIAGSYKPLERSLNQPGGRLKPPGRRLNLPKKRLPKVIHLGDPDVTHIPKPILKEIKKPLPAYVEPEKPIVRCLNCPNPRVSKDNLCGGCQGLKDRGFKLVYYEKYLKRNRRAIDYETYIKRRRAKWERNAENKNDAKEEGLFSQRFIDKLSEIL